MVVAAAVVAAVGVVPGEGKIIARWPVVKFQCKLCKRVDQCVGRAFGSVNWVRDLPFAKTVEFYNRAHQLTASAIRDMCSHVVAWKK